MSFFKKFPTIPYDYNRDGIIRNAVSIFKSIRALRSTLDSTSIYTFYEVKNGERPDVVSTRLYGTPEYYWTFFIVNDFLHDGMRAWPMSQEDLDEYMKTEYDGFAITTRPVIVRDTDQIITDFRNSLAGRFKVGERIIGVQPGISTTVSNPNDPDALSPEELQDAQITGCGQLYKKSIDMNQLIIRTCNGTFIGDPDAINNSTQLLIGQTTRDSVSTYEVYNYIDAPYYYYRSDDPEKRPVDNALFIQGGTPDANLDFVTNRQFLFEQNKERSKLRVISPAYIDEFVETFKRLINE